MAKGVDPTTGEVLPEDHFINKPQVIRALSQTREIILAWSGTKNAAENQGKPWSDVEETALTQAFRRGDKIKDIAAQHKRTTGAIRSRLVRLELIEPGR